MRKFAIGLVLTLLVTSGGCRAIYGAIWQAPKWVDGKVLNVYTGNGHYDGKARWDNFTRQYQQIWNVIDIYAFNYDITDPYASAPFFGDPH